VFHIYSRKVSRLPEIIRQQRKRALGQPRTGRMSLVMTDIQGFTRLMESNADNTTQVGV
jgi:class 3 adenylate cyclase